MLNSLSSLFFPVWSIPQSFIHICGPLLDSLQYVHSFLLLCSPELDTVLQMLSHQFCVERENQLPLTSCQCFSWNSQGYFATRVQCSLTVGSLSSRTPPHILLCTDAVQLLNPQCVTCLGLFLPQVQGFASPIVEPHEIPLWPFLFSVSIVTVSKDYLEHFFFGVCRLNFKIL